MSILDLKTFKMIKDEQTTDILSNDIFSEINQNIYNIILHIIDMDNNILLTYDF